MKDLAADALNAAIVALESDPWIRDPEAGRKGLLYNFMCEIGQDQEGHLFTGEYPERVISLAKAGDRVAHDALFDVAQHLIDRKEAVPAELSRYMMDVARSGVIGRPGRHWVTNLYRDQAIYRAIEAVVAMGISATRNPDKNRPTSACLIVSKALEQCGITMKESSVVTVWQNRRKARKAAGFAVA